jgi:hypothetical protein
VTGPGVQDGRSAPGGGAGGGDRINLGRGVALVVVAFVVGVILLNVGSRPPVNTGAVTTTPPSTVATTTVPGSTTSTTAHATTTTAHGTTTTAGHGTTTTAHGATTTTTTTVPRSSVKVLVANGTAVPNQATNYSRYLSGQGWNTLPPADATTQALKTSTVYYAQGAQSSAETIASSLGLPATAVAPLTTSVPVSSTTGADVVVVIGADLAGKTPGTTPSTTTT